MNSQASGLMREGDGGASIIPSMHDGLLLGLSLAEDDGLEITFQTTAKKKIHIRLPRLVALKCDNFRQGNIVFAIRLYEKSNCPHDLVGRAYGYSKEEAAKFLAVRLSELEPGDWSLVEVQESYGCELVALSRGPLCDWSIKAQQDEAPAS